METTNSKILLALLGGVAVGAALGLLFAPYKGNETRQKISDTAQDLADRIMGKAEELVEESDDIRRKAKSKVNNNY